jgi:protoheme IX farnesyltransferase
MAAHSDPNVTSAVRSIKRSQSRTGEKLRGYWSLIKSLQTLLLLATGLTGYLSARPDDLMITTVLLMLLSLSAAISGTTVLNMVFDRDIDARMGRTAQRPLPAGTLAPSAAITFGGILVVVGVGIAFGLGGLFGLVVTAGVFLDLVVYTIWLKRRSAWAIVFGGVSGGMPILAGRALGTGQVDVLGLLLALSVLTWIPSHIVTLAIKYDDDYRHAGIPTWPNVYGFASARRFVALSNGLRVITLFSAGWMLRICPYSLGLLSLSGVVMLGLSIWAIVRPSERLNYGLFKFASVHMLGSMVLITLGAMI